jgi:hypothetical protein
MKNSPKRQWTVLAYLAGDNNLSAEMVWALQEMKKAAVGPDEAVTVVAQFDPQGYGLATQRFVINKKRARAGAVKGDGGADAVNDFHLNGTGRQSGSLYDDADLAEKLDEKLNRDFIADLVSVVVTNRKKFPTLTRHIPPTPGKTVVLPPQIADPATDDTGNPWTLLRFLYWGVKNFPAEKYMVVLSGHGSGSDGDFLKDESSGGSLTVRALGEVFAALRRFGVKADILGLDSCLMSTAEVYFELRGSVDVMVGAEGVEPNAGWPYFEIMDDLARNPGASPREYARRVVELYTGYYFNYALGGVSVDLAACDVTKAGELKDGLSRLSEELLAQLAKGSPAARQVADALLAAHWTAQTYKFDQYTDLRDFCAELKGRVPGKVAKACEQVIAAVESVVLRCCTSGPEAQYSSGLSVYFPWAQIAEEYKDLDFARATKWGSFLTEYVERVSRRGPRRECEDVKGRALKAVLNPKPYQDGIARQASLAAEVSNGDFTSIKYAPPQSKYAPPQSKYAPPQSKNLSGRAISPKNSPVKWCPGCCPESEER